MANQIQKKFILDGAVDGLKIKLLKDQALVGTLQDGSSVDLIKLDGSDKVLVKGVEVGLKSEIDQSLVDAKAYADQKITDLVNGADVALDTLKEIGDQLASDQSAVSSLVLTVASNLVEAKGYTDTEVAAKLVDAKAYTDAQIAAIPPVDISDKADIIYVDSQNAQVLVDAKAYTDAQIAAIPPVDISGKADITYVDAADLVLDGKISDVVSDVADLDGYAQDIRSDLDAAIVSYQAADIALLASAQGYADTQDAAYLVTAKAYTDAQIAAIPAVDLSVIEGEIDALQLDVVALQNALQVKFEKESFVAEAPLTDITLAHEALEKSLVVHVGRLALHAGEDYTVSVVEGKSKLTWAGDFAVGGVEGIEVGDKIKVVYSYMG